MKKRNAFTLAEVLITLGIIGIVSAMTLPTIIANGKKQETVSRLKKFNSMMLQAILLSQNDNGPSEYWQKESMPTNDDGSYDEIKGSMQAEEFFNKYFASYIKYIRLDSSDECNPKLRLVFNDGSTACLKNGAYFDLRYDVNGAKKPNKGGYDRFYFSFHISKSSSFYQITRRYFAPYINGMTQEMWSDRDKLKELCLTGESGACARLIEVDGWQIKDDYPFHF